MILFDWLLNIRKAWEAGVSHEELEEWQSKHPEPIQGPVKTEWEPLGQIAPGDLPEPSEQYPAPWTADYRGNGHFDIFDGQGRCFAHIYIWGITDGEVYQAKMKAAQ
jgi:hypothetical protein